MPSLSKARDQAKTVQCISNLRQIGLGHARYVIDYKGYIVPCDIGDWAAPTTANGVTIKDSWCTLLVAGGYLPNPPSVAGAPVGDNTILKCPSGNEDVVGITSISSGLPTSRTDGRGTMGVQYTSGATGIDPGLIVYCWYGINGTSGSDKAFPVRRWPADGTSPTDPTKPPPNTPKMSQVRHSSELVFLFDGIAGLNLQTVNANRINARHRKNTATNILFFDNHAETFNTKDLPGGIGDANPASTTFGWNAATHTGNLANYPQVKWRLDQD